MRQFSWALVTGASSGIGEALSCLLADKGINVILHGRDAARLNALAEALSTIVQVKIVPADLATSEGRASVVKVIHEHVPSLVVNNAGYGLYGDALTHETSAQMQILDVDAAAVLELTLEAARALISKGERGVILNVSSAAAFPPFPGFSVYSACKAFVNQFSLSFDEEVRAQGVRVLAACPGMVETGFRKRAAGGTENAKEASTTPNSTMTAAYAAEQIWNQIVSLNQVHIFDWKIRTAIFFQSFLPRQWVGSVLRKNIASRYQPREIIKIPSQINQTKS